MSYELLAILATSMLELAALVAGCVYLSRQSRYTAEHLAVANRYLADQVAVTGQRLAEEVKSSREDLEAQLRRNAYLQTLTHDWSADRLKEILALLQKGEL